MNNFGSGFLYGVPTADATGAAIANPSPVQFGVLQDVSVDFAFENKMLYGQNQFPVAVGRGKGKIGIKAKFANINGALMNSVVFGVAPTSSIVSAVNELVGKAIPTTPFTLTAGASNSAILFQIPDSGAFSRDLGVRDSFGRPMVAVASAPAAGQYTVSGVGAYVFNTADAGKIVFINYEYTAVSTVAKTFTVTNQAMGYAPTFMCVLTSKYNGGYLHLRFPSCISNKFAISTKNDDFTIPEVDIDAFADSAGNVALGSISE